MKIEFFDSISRIDGLPEYHQEYEKKDKIKLLDVVALIHNIPEYNLRRGEVGTVVEILSDGDAFEVEFSDRNGQMYKSLSFRASQLMVLHHEGIQKPPTSIGEKLGQMNAQDQLIPWSLNCLYSNSTSEKL